MSLKIRLGFEVGGTDSLSKSVTGRNKQTRCGLLSKTQEPMVKTCEVNLRHPVGPDKGREKP